MSERLLSGFEGGRSRSFFARLKGIDEKKNMLLVVNAKGEEMSVGLDKRARDTKQSVTEVALARFPASTSGASIEAIVKEGPWLRIAGLNAFGQPYRITKVGTRYPKVSRDDMAPPEKRINARKEVQEGRRCVEGYGRMRLYYVLENQTMAPSFQFIPKNCEPGKVEPIEVTPNGGEQIFDAIKERYAKFHRDGMRQMFTFSSVSSEGAYGEATVMGPLTDDEHQPNEAFTQKRPMRPQEFSNYIDNVKEGVIDERDRLGKALQRVAEKGGAWKMVNGYTLKFSFRLSTHLKDKPSGRIGNNLQEDIVFGQVLRENNEVDVGWRKPLDNLDGYADFSVVGRVGGLQDGFVPMQAVLARDQLTKQIVVDDATTIAPSKYLTEALVADPRNIEDWHEGRTQSVGPSLDLLVPRGAREPAREAEEGQHEEAAAQSNGGAAPAPQAGEAEGWEELDAATDGGADAWSQPGIETEEEVPF